MPRPRARPEPRRAEIIVPGLAVLLRFLLEFRLPAVYYSRAGVRDGIIADLAARGVGDFSQMLKNHAEHAPLKRNVEPREVGDTALFLSSDLGSGITGETIYVDCGYNIMGF